jgi:hypothetical protein
MLCRAHRFLGGHEIVEYEPYSGRPCTSNMEENMTKVRALMRSDHLLTVTMISSELNLIHQTIHDILTEKLGIWTLGCCITTMLPVTLPPHERSFDQK